MNRLLCLMPLLLCACTTQRVLHIENQLLLQQAEELHSELASLQRRLPAEADYSPNPDLALVSSYLDRADYRHVLVPDGSHIRLDFVGMNTSFSVDIQHFERGGILFLATRNFLSLDAARDTPSLVLVLTQLAVLNYEMLVGKFQLNPESGEILLSVEIPLRDGLGYDTFIETLDKLCQTADNRYPSLVGAASGLGM